jgi:hypothetical protein
MRESQIEKYLVAKVKELGGEVRKVQWVGRRGAPDRVVFFGLNAAAERLDEALIAAADGDHIDTYQLLRDIIGDVLAWSELKAPGEKAKPHQLREHERMRAMGQRVEVIDSIEGVEELLR